MSNNERALIAAKSKAKKLGRVEFTLQDDCAIGAIVEEYEAVKAAEQPDNNLRSVGLTDGERQEEAKELGVRVPGAAPSQQPVGLPVNRNLLRAAIYADIDDGITGTIPSATTKNHLADSIMGTIAPFLATRERESVTQSELQEEIRQAVWKHGLNGISAASDLMVRFNITRI